MEKSIPLDSLDIWALIVACGAGFLALIKYAVKLRDKAVLMEMDNKVLENNKILKKEIRADIKESEIRTLFSIKRIEDLIDRDLRHTKGNNKNNESMAEQLHSHFADKYQEVGDKLIKILELVEKNADKS